MKLKPILNGIAALLAVGMFYTFSFCMVQEVNEGSISAGYCYTKDTSEKQTEMLPVNISGSAVMTAETADILRAQKAPLTMKVPSFAPSSDELLVSGSSDDEITDENYRENSFSYSGLSDDELGLIFPEEEDVNDYIFFTAENSSGHSSNFLFDSDDITVRSGAHGSLVSASADEVRRNGSVYSADEINSGKITSPAKKKKKKKKTPVSFPEVSPISSISDVMGGSESGYDTYQTFDEETGCGETLVVKVGGEVREYDAYELVCLIVNNEMSASFNMEALKAQAVAAYSYVKYHMDRGLTATVLVREDVPDRIKEAVSSVWGQCCYYNGRPAQTVYTASTSGYTADCVSVWGGDKVPYLISKECPFDVAYDPNYGIEKVYTEEEMRTKLQSYLGITLSDNPENWITVTDYIDGNYVGSIDVDGQATVSGVQMREKILGFKIKSASFKVSYSDGEFTFTTYGYGHGVGMSQNGANILAGQGYSYIDILKFYYEGITVS